LEQPLRLLLHMLFATGMKTERWQEISHLYDAALARDAGQRAAFLRDACAGDLALRREVEALLAQQASGFLEGPAVAAAASTVSTAGESVLTGRRLGAYQVHERIGVGGMGEVYRARDTKLGRDVAIKILPRLFTSDPDRLARFEREARMLASLNHPNIATIHGVEDSDGVHALVMELIDGETLAEKIAGSTPRASGSKAGGLALIEALTIAHQIADALEAAHEKGIIHRDLKPANVKITRDGIVKVLDFGLAKLDDTGRLGDVGGNPTITMNGTHEGAVLGTAAYMSPEQARGRPIDKRTDIWAFGCVLYEMLTGTLAFKGESVADTIATILEREPDLSLVPPSPARVRLLIRRCLEKDARRRLRDIADARMEIDETIAQPAIADAGTVPIALRQQHHWSWLAIALLVGFGAALSVGWLGGRRQETAAAPTFDRMIRLVSTAAHEFGPVISPDGKWVAYLSNARGPTDVWVKFIAGGDPINLTASTDITVQSVDYIGGLAVSPDGSTIAFQAQAPLQLGFGSTWVIPAPLGGAPRRKLPTGSSGMHWSPDGKRIAYVKTGGPLGDALMVADADGQHEVVVVKRQGARHVHWLHWDPSGTYVYFNHGFQNFNTEPTEIFRAAVSGGPIERVISTARRAAFPFPHEQGLFYAANPDGVDLSLWWKDLSSGRDYRLTTGVGEYSSPSVSADGRRLVGTVVEVRQSLQRVAVAFDRPIKLEPLTDGFSGDVDPAWSPDGTHLVFSSSRTGNRTLWTARGDLTQPAPLTSDIALDERPVYSPDGQQIAFVSDRGGRRGIWRVSTESGAPQLIAAADVIDTISWSPDGRRLVFSTPVGDAPGLMTMDVATGQTARVPTAAAATAPAWSPRDDVIAYIEPRGGTVGAFVQFVTSNGQAIHDRVAAPEKLTFGNGFVSWSPDGRRLAAVSLPGAFSGSIWIIEPEGATPFRKLVDLTAGVFLRGVTWSRDGSSLIVGRIQWAGDIFFVERSVKP
jgi:eukaryotic-like serine/threonine-protein kinase